MSTPVISNIVDADLPIMDCCCMPVRLITHPPRPAAGEEPVRVDRSAGSAGHAGPPEGPGCPPGDAAAPEDRPAGLGRTGLPGGPPAAGRLRAGPRRHPPGRPADTPHPRHPAARRPRPADAARARRPHPRRAHAEVRHAAARQRPGGCAAGTLSLRGA